MLEEFKVQHDCEINGWLIKKGDRFNRVEIAEVDNKYYQFPAFYSWKVYIDLARKSELELEKSLAQLKLIENGRAIDGKKIYLLCSNIEDGVMNYFQALISCYIFSFTALEAYVNFRLDSIEPKIEDFVNCEALSKFKPYFNLVFPINDIIRLVGLDDKLFEILPYFYQKKKIDLSPVRKFKNNFNCANYVRNELIHFKRSQNRTGQDKSGKFNTVKLWNLLVPKFEDNKFRLSFNPINTICSIIHCMEDAFSGVLNKAS